MKHIEVVAAIIRKGDNIFATQRGYGDWKDWWEFPVCIKGLHTSSYTAWESQRGIFSLVKR